MRISRHLFWEILTFAGLLLATVLALGWWGLVKVLDAQAWAQAEQSTQRLTRELDRKTEEVQRLGMVLRSWWLSGAYRLDDPEGLDRLVLPILGQQLFVSSINFCAADGTSVLLLRRDGAWDSRWLSPGPAGRRLRWTRRQADGRAAVEPWTPTSYDPRDRDWYRLVARGEEPRWSPEAYRFMTTGEPGITLSLPVRRGRELVGVIALDVLLDELTSQTWAAQPTPGTQVAIADAQGRAVVLPHRPEYARKEARLDQFLKPVGALAPELGPLAADLASVSEEGRRVEHAAGGSSYGLVRRYRGPLGLDWYLLVAIPQREILRSTRDGASAVLALAVIGFAVLAWRAWAISRRFGRPLDSLASAADAPPTAGPAEGGAPRNGGSAARAIGEILRLADRAVEEQLLLREQLQESQRRETVGTLASGVAHDVNNQLTVVIGELDAGIEALGADHPLSQDLLLARQAARRSGELTRALLTYSRPALRKGGDRVDVNRLVRSVSALVGRVLGHGITLVQELTPDLPPVAGREIELEQVLVNLVLNARDAMAQGGTITVRTALDPGDGSVRLEVKDDGVGMTPEVQARIFEAFFTTKAEGRGTGLGLAMVQGIVRSHGGRIEVRSQPGVGSTFTVHLPRSGPPAAGSGRPANPAHAT